MARMWLLTKDKKGSEKEAGLRDVGLDADINDGEGWGFERGWPGWGDVEEAGWGDAETPGGGGPGLNGWGAAAGWGEQA